MTKKRQAARPHEPAYCLGQPQKDPGEDTADDAVAGFFVIDGDLLGVEPQEVELDLKALEAAVSLARSETSLPL